MDRAISQDTSCGDSASCLPQPEPLRSSSMFLASHHCKRRQACPIQPEKPSSSSSCSSQSPPSEMQGFPEFHLRDLLIVAPSAVRKIPLKMSWALPCWWLVGCNSFGQHSTTVIVYLVAHDFERLRHQSAPANASERSPLCPPSWTTTHLRPETLHRRPPDHYAIRPAHHHDVDPNPILADWGLGGHLEWAILEVSQGPLAPLCSTPADDPNSSNHTVASRQCLGAFGHRIQGQRVRSHTRRVLGKTRSSQ